MVCLWYATGVVTVLK